MEYFTKFKKTFEEQATAAASTARGLAENFSEKAQEFATKASTNATTIANKLKEDTFNLTWQEAAEKAKAKFSQFSHFNSKPVESFTEAEIEAFGISESYKDFLRSLDYSTFRDYNEYDIQSNICFMSDQEGNLRLNPWQERHAHIALSLFSELNHLRYLLCPKRMSEEKFWLIYFSLAQSHLPEGCTSGKLPDLSQQTAEPVEKEAPAEPIATTGEADQSDNADEDNLDKYLNDVLQKSDSAQSIDADFEDLDDYMEQLNAEIGSDKDQSLPSDVVDSIGDDIQEEKH